MRALLEAGDALAARLRLLDRLQEQAREREDQVVDLPVGELFDATDRAALDAWEAARNAATGQVTLPFERVS
jgi:hypothetical protein